MRVDERQRSDRFARRCRHQEAEKDERRQRDDVGHVGRARSARRGRLTTMQSLGRSAAHRPQGETCAEQDREHCRARCKDENRF